MLDSLLAAALGLTQGLRHALEPDHVTALAAAVAPKSSARAGIGYAARWGFGHGAVLVLLGGACVISGRSLPARAASLFELVVGAMLVAIGVSAVLRARGGDSVASPDRATPQIARRPVLIGCIHGLAGTGAVVAVALGSTMRGGLVALGLYATGAALGMVLLAGAAGPLLARVGSSPRFRAIASYAAGALSVGLGLYWGARALADLVA